MFLLQTKALIVDQVLRIGDVQIYLPREMVHPARLEKVIKSPGRTTTGSPTWLTVSIEPSGIRGKEDRDHGTMAPHKVTIHLQQLQISHLKVKRTVYSTGRLFCFLVKDTVIQLCIMATLIQHGHCSTIGHLYQDIPWKDFDDSSDLGQDTRVVFDVVGRIATLLSIMTHHNQYHDGHHHNFHLSGRMFHLKVLLQEMIKLAAEPKTGRLAPTENDTSIPRSN